MADCIFCKIISGEMPSYKVYEDEHTCAFLDIHPVNKGHALIISKKHYADFLEADGDTLARLSLVAQKVARAVKESLDADGCNVTTNVGTAAGQVIFHVHWHIIPRFKNDGFKLWPSQGDYNEGEAQAIKEVISQNL
ncbi:HIT family protein [Candidatus Uhrbacteria bacterium]|nr:HIT family protein [Candidatus Uhrbacteria bacterium]